MRVHYCTIVAIIRRNVLLVLEALRKTATTLSAPSDLANKTLKRPRPRDADTANHLTGATIILLRGRDYGGASA